MNKPEFKRAWRAFRTEIRDRQAAFDFGQHDGMTRDIDTFGRFLCAGFTKTQRTIVACRMSNSGKNIAELVNPTRLNYNPEWRREAVRISRLYGPIFLGKAGA